MKAFIPTAALCALLCACGADDQGSHEPELVYTTYQSSLTRNANPDINQSEFTQLVRDNNQFALDMFHSIKSTAQKDVVASPFSISTTLAMTYAGAGDATKQQIAQALRFGLDDAILHAGFNRLTAAINERQLPAMDDLDALEVQIVNAVWPALGNPPAQEYLDTLALNYGEGVYALDYPNRPEESRLAINESVEDWTAGLVTDLLPAGAITSLTQIVLTNTIYLKAPWHSPFQEQLTQPRDFNNLDGTVSRVDTMTGEATVHHAVLDDAEVMLLPFRGEQLEMAFVMPSLGTYESYLAQLEDMGTLSAQLDAADQVSATVLLPKFQHEFDASLIEPLESLGMVDAFRAEAANFDGMGLGDRIHLTAIQHKAVVEIDEGGVVAAAATAAVGGTTSVPLPIHVDRPFIYLIRDRTTGSILFLGEVTTL